MAETCNCFANAISLECCNFEEKQLRKKTVFAVTHFALQYLCFQVHKRYGVIHVHRTFCTF